MTCALFLLSVLVLMATKTRRKKKADDRCGKERKEKDGFWVLKLSVQQFCTALLK
jgi:hypothetical protein